MSWGRQSEYSENVGDVQAMPDEAGGVAIDMLNVQRSVEHMIQTPLGEPRVDFDVRAIYDSRPVNGYDFNFSAIAQVSGLSVSNWSVTFLVPNGYRIIPREWDVTIQVSSASSGVLSQSTATLQQNNADLPNNSPVYIGYGTGARPIKSFYICEANTTFGIRGSAGTLGNSSPGVIINCYGNLLAVTDVALPFEVTNKKFGS